MGKVNTVVGGGWIFWTDILETASAISVSCYLLPLLSISYVTDTFLISFLLLPFEVFDVIIPIFKGGIEIRRDADHLKMTQLNNTPARI